MTQESVRDNQGKENNMAEIVGDGLNYDISQVEPVYTNRQFDECVVYIRPNRSWEGKEFGFDWVRTGQTDLPGDIKYHDHMGRYYDGTTNGKKNYEKDSGNYKKKNSDEKLAFEKDPEMYQKWIRKYFPIAYPVTWKRESYNASDKYDENKKKAKFMYYVPVMTLMPGKTAELILKVETAGRRNTPPERIYLKFQDSNISKALSIIEGGEIVSPERNKKYKCKIKCSDRFFTEQFVDVIAEYSTEEKRLCGQLRILSNRIFFDTINVLCVNVKTKIGEETKGRFDSDTANRPNETKLRDVLGQAMVSANVEQFGTDGILEIDADKEYHYPLNLKPEDRIEYKLKDFVASNCYEAISEILSICSWAYLAHYTEPVRQRIQPKLEQDIEDEFHNNISQLEEQKKTNIITEKEYKTKKEAYIEKRKRQRSSLPDVLKNEIEKELKKNEEYTKYQHYYKVFFLGDPYKKNTILADGSKSTSNVKGVTVMKNRTIIIFSNQDRQTVTHEMLHALQLEHSFAARIEEYNRLSQKNDIHNPTALYTFSAEKTDNVMDYPASNTSSNDNATLYYNTWQWQWELIWKEVLQHQMNMFKFNL